MKKNKALIMLIAFATLTINLAAQSMNDMKGMHMDATNQTINKAVCVLIPTAGNNVFGVVTFTKVENGVQVVADLTGLTQGKHGFHIHEFGDCTSTDGTSAGGHFNPTNMEHGSPMESMHHAGDLGNVVADSNGKAHLEYLDKDISLMGMKSIIGRSVVVHKGEDDMKTQPTGNSGARVAYGVIGIAK